MEPRELVGALLEGTTADQVTVPRRALQGIVSRLSELEERAALQENDPDEHLSLARAAFECGYSADYLGRLIRKGALTNHGSKARPRVRRGDLPRKATALPLAARSA